MDAALALGRRGAGRCWPNPAVGCVIVRDGRLVGRGRTADGGRPHAETAALAQAGVAARGATVYVTLEPCAHHGVTPPCADALIAAGVARVVVAMRDPDPRTNGKGIARLRAAGIEVATGPGGLAAIRDLAPFVSRLRRGRPRVTLKLAASVDGRIATASGESRWITGPEARRWVHAARMRHDAVMVGAGTARADDPDLRVRGMGADRVPVRVVVSRRLDLDPASRLGRTAREAPVWLPHGPGASEEAVAAWAAVGARPLLVEGEESAPLDPKAVLARLAVEGLTSVFVEGGGSLAASLLSGGLVDELALFTAGVAIGAEGRPGIGALGLGRLFEAPRLKLREARRVGGDVLSIWADIGSERDRAGRDDPDEARRRTLRKDPPPP